MAIITVSSMSWSGGSRVGRELADRLEYDFWDKGIIHRVALEVNVTPKQVEEFEEENHSRFHTLMSDLFDLDALKNEAKASEQEVAGQEFDDRNAIPFQFAVDGWIDSEIYRKVIMKTVTRLGDEGNVVILGRGGQAILRDNSEAIHVRFVADMNDRVQWAMRDLDCDEAKARLAVQESDTQSRKYLDYYFRINPDLPGHYDIVFNTSRIGRDQCVSILESLVRKNET